MPIFSYKGLDKTGKEIKATINTDSIISAKQKIKSMGVMLIDIKEKKAKEGVSFNFGKKVKVQDLALMTRQLATLVKAKIQIVEALAALQDQVDNEHLKVVLSEVKSDVNEGSSLAKSMSKHPKVFNNVYINMVEAGEASGTLEIVLLRLADFTEAQMKLKNKIQSAMTYPILMALIGFGMMNVIFIFVIPKIAKVFTAMKKDLPLPTQISIGISHFMQHYWWALILGIIFSVWAFFKYINSKSGRRNWDGLVLKLPIFGVLVKMINVSRFCSTLATLLASGVPILTAMNIVKNLVPNVWMNQAIEKAKENISEGGSIATALKDSGHYPSMVTHMITLGERSGELESMLKIVSENYEEQVDSKISGLTSLLEPLMMVGMGLAVGFIVMAVVVPMMDMSSIKR
jgi:general secretion pathway protein F